jgi:hypothetical protein
MDLSTAVVKEKIGNGVCEIRPSVDILDICTLPNNRILSGGFTALTIYDENFNEIKRVDRINDKIIDCYGVASDQNSFIFASSVVNNCMHKLDMELNLIATFGVKGTTNGCLWVPTGICYYNNHLYICDSNNKRIQIINIELEYVGTMQLDYPPHTIRISSTTIAIYGYNKTVNFYDLTTKTLKRQFVGILGRISEIHYNFYVTSWNPSMRIHCFNNEGENINEINLDRFSQHGYFVNEWGWDGHIYFLNNSIYITSFSKRCLLKFAFY